MKMKTIKPNKLEETYRMFSGNPVLYHSSMKVVTGSVNAGLLISYLLYWQGKGAKGEWTYKTIAAIEKDIGLSRSNQDSAIRLCQIKGLLDVRRRGIPATRHFKVNTLKLTSIILSLQETGRLDKPKTTTNAVDTRQTNTESYPEKYTEINIPGLNKFKALKAKQLTSMTKYSS